jgi:hypothetical protein
MPFTVTQYALWRDAASLQILDAGADDVEVLVTSTGSIWLDGSAVAGPNAGLYLGADERWCRFAVTSGDELWAFSNRDVVITVMVRSEAA